ncbi:MAG: TolC family protein [Alistipes sp.]|nr:TolC family protein [Alistipes sp.]
MQAFKKLFSAAVGLAAFSYIASAQPGWQEQAYGIVRQVEVNNPELEARRKLRDALGVDARLDNNLYDPQVEYVHLWGRPSAAGPTSELTVSQAFDFPTVYARRAKLAELRAATYGYEYETYRQQLLFEAHSLCINIVALQARAEVLAQAMEDAGALADAIRVKFEQGGANSLEVEKTRFEYISAANACKLNEIELSEARTRLSALNGDQPVEPVEGGGLDTPPLLRPYEELAAIYEEMAPELLTALSELEAARQDIRVSRSKSLPGFAVGYRRDTGPGEKFNGVVAGVSIPIFSNRHNVRRAQAEAAWAEAEVRRVRSDMRVWLSGLYARADLLGDYTASLSELQDHGHTLAMLRRAIETGHISVTDYYSQLQPVYDSRLSIIDVWEEYHLVCARINAAFL